MRKEERRLELELEREGIGIGYTESIDYKMYSKSGAEKDRKNGEESQSFCESCPQITGTQRLNDLEIQLRHLNDHSFHNP